MATSLYGARVAASRYSKAARETIARPGTIWTGCSFAEGSRRRTLEVHAGKCAMIMDQSR